MTSHNSGQGQPCENVQTTPLCTFAMLADVQYADIDDGMSYDKTRHRYFRSAIDGLRRAVEQISNYRGESEQSSETTEQPSDTTCILQLGDLIDGKSNTEEALKKAQDIFDAYKNPVYHVVGNHELYNFTKTQLKSTYLHHNRDEDAPLYFDAAISAGVRLVVLDCYDFGVLGYGRHAAYEASEATEEYHRAAQFLLGKNHNDDWNSSENLPHGQRHFVAYNGGIGDVQLQWLEGVLQEATIQGEKVIMAGHIPLCISDEWMPYCTNLVWNYPAVLEVVHKYPCVVAYFCGHDHDGGYHHDSHGVHHVIVQAVLETEPGIDAFAFVHVHEDKLVIDGRGRVSCRVLQYRQ